MGKVRPDSVEITWERSQYNGGAPINAYVVEKRDASKNNWIEAARIHPDSLTKTRVGKLWEGCKYHFRVAAENDLGFSPYAQTDEPVVARKQFGGLVWLWLFKLGFLLIRIILLLID